jgi:diguanylate cyclase (GGDEF)-like protein/PAS domain S-box-containing protein
MTDSDAGVYPPNVHKAYYRALFESLPYGVCRTDVHGTVQEANQALLTMMACNSVIEIAASDLTKKIIEDANERARVFESESESEKVYTELDWVRKDGVALRVRVSGRLARDEEGTNCGYLLVVENRNEQRAIEAQLRSVAQTDALTGLQNYRSLQDALETEIRRSARTGREFSLLLLDLDGMKEINDSFGHMEGNRALCRVAEIMRQCCREVDTPARFGGDEFAVVLPETVNADAWRLAMRIFNVLNADQSHPKVSVSLGCATYPFDGQSVENLLVAADKALYEMKNGRQLPLFVFEHFERLNAGEDRTSVSERSAD